MQLLLPELLHLRFRNISWTASASHKHQSLTDGTRRAVFDYTSSETHINMLCVQKHSRISACTRVLKQLQTAISCGIQGSGGSSHFWAALCLLLNKASVCAVWVTVPRVDDPNAFALNLDFHHFISVNREHHLNSTCLPLVRVSLESSNSSSACHVCHALGSISTSVRDYVVNIISGPSNLSKFFFTSISNIIYSPLLLFYSFSASDTFGSLLLIFVGDSSQIQAVFLMITYLTSVKQVLEIVQF